MSKDGFASPPAPPSERGAWLLACSLGLLGLAVLVAVLSGVVGASTSTAVAPPPVLAAAATPVPAPSARADASATGAGDARAAIVASPTPAQQRADARLLLDPTQSHISRRWMEGFYPIYATAQRTFGVNWLLLASIHRQESAFSTAPGIYHGLNFARCCGGPMQFNVTNGGAGAPSTWDLVSDSYLYGARPARYDHMTAKHPSIYDDFDAIMAAAHLLSADGAEYRSTTRRGWRPTTTTATTPPAWNTPTRCSRARSAGPSTASASTAAWTRSSSTPSTRPTARRC